jgi:hypothetical protein
LHLILDWSGILLTVKRAVLEEGGGRQETPPRRQQRQGARRGIQTCLHHKQLQVEEEHREERVVMH